MAVLPATNLKVLQEQMHFYKTLYTSNKHRSSILNDSLRIFTENIIPLQNDNIFSEGKVTQEDYV